MDIEQGKTLLEILLKRCGEFTEVWLGEDRIEIYNIVYGQDLGADFAHITTNIEPIQDDIPSDFFYINEITRMIDPENNIVIYESA